MGYGSQSVTCPGNFLPKESGDDGSFDLLDGQAGRYTERQSCPTKLDPFNGYLRERVAAVRPRWIPTTVLLGKRNERGAISHRPKLRKPSTGDSKSLLM